ncbi:Nif3-like dinuclear metal center hexameric protein [Nocardioides sp. MAH-18]|uniref:GTP cyclohydrolase 1 type 2 homolog n=1 Tax=Nocardioides agri TaxID=2682843 RepID=A0A6L6Y1B2_9ACTN|nr:MULTISPECIES: Nif3-like dinuclear metal center hexameric protein [unclassified Nocardioides]MBA2952179.1 Nif3-like dinuclear metal center hexameric protein [Nocardioides sp. CGMCC 1.13656]MVQ51345.1 Nif3-like dinuclear metal center hexameric protein [Nocardioides sp. MAH-18]
MPALEDVVDLLHGWYPPATADSWDAVGLVLGHPIDQVGKVLFAVDPTIEVAREAAGWGADLLVVHHPLFLKPVHGFAATTPKGRTLATLAGAGCALLTAHTNADQAVAGVSESLALAIGLTDLEPIQAAPAAPMDKLTTYVPAADAPAMRVALAAAGAGRIGDYDHASFSTPGEGRFRPLEGANPTIGTVGEVETVAEERVEVVLPRSRRASVVRAMLAAHPYEEPAFDVVEMVDPGTAPTGTGRIGDLAPTTLRRLAETVAAALPETAHGVRVGGDPERVVRRVAVCGGAGDFLLDAVARTDADVYLTSDLRHHPAAEFLEKGGPALVDVAHWAAEWTWLPVVEARLREALGDTLETRVSTICTDPWTFRS